MDGAEARAVMVERLRSKGVLHTAAVEAAMAAVPRHEFIDGADAETAYADRAVTVKTVADGTAISSASQPTIVACMLELSQLAPGHRVLEIGTGTGYNAALLASVVGAEGHVVTIELDDDLAVTAERRLGQHGFDRVSVVVGDGVDGNPPAAPYDVVIVTTGAPSIAEAWVDQLRPGGRLVVPLVGPDGIGSIHCLVRDEGGLTEIARLPCGFLPMRTAG